MITICLLQIAIQTSSQLITQFVPAMESFLHAVAMLLIRTAVTSRKFRKVKVVRMNGLCFSTLRLSNFERISNAGNINEGRGSNCVKSYLRRLR